MGSRATLNDTIRCDRCRLLNRWCVCAGLEPVHTAVRVDVLMHRRERQRPTSTGHLIDRIVAGARQHVFTPGQPLDPTTVRDPARDLWILHPQGDPPSAGVDPKSVQVLLLDGNWGEAGMMSRAVVGWGRRVCLPMTGSSRYWLRAQRDEGEFSTVEALIFLLGFLGCADEQAAVQRQLELHVYAGLLSRGQKVQAARYLADSPVRTVWPELVRKLGPQPAARDADASPGQGA
ncbi:MAG TPA: DTW domain-containing protein [Opitutaceae bacterium]